MSIFGYFCFLLFPSIAFSCANEDCFKCFVNHFQKKRFNESLQLLESWECAEPSAVRRICGMKAAVYLAMGDLEESRAFMDAFVRNLEIKTDSDPLLDYGIQMFYKALEGHMEGSSTPNALALFCKHEQPKGVKFKYWFGVGQILVGILAVPFSGGASTALILSGTALVVDAASDALNNQENWERELDERRRMDADIQNNSFLHSLPYCLPNAQAMLLI